jgi:hypothetical protein
VTLLPLKAASYKTGDNRPDGVPVPHPDDIYARILMLRESRGYPLVIVSLDCAMAIEKIVKVRNAHGNPSHTGFAATLPSDTIAKWRTAAGLPAGSLNLSVHATHTDYAPDLHDTATSIENEIASMAAADQWKEVTVHGGVVPSSLPVSRLKGIEGSTNIDRS